jgi:hypothetical protein
VRRLGSDDVCFLIAEKRRPEGVATAPDGTPRLTRYDQLLVFPDRIGVISEQASKPDQPETDVGRTAQLMGTTYDAKPKQNPAVELPGAFA